MCCHGSALSTTFFFVVAAFRPLDLASHFYGLTFWYPSEGKIRVVFPWLWERTLKRGEACEAWCRGLDGCGGGVGGLEKSKKRRACVAYWPAALRPSRTPCHFKIKRSHRKHHHSLPNAQYAAIPFLIVSAPLCPTSGALPSIGVLDGMNTPFQILVAEHRRAA